MTPANSLPEDEVTGDLELIAEDFQRAADAGIKEHTHIRLV